MAKKKSSNIIKNDFEFDEGEVLGFTSEFPITGDCISSFSFDDNSIFENIHPNSECNPNNNAAETDSNIIAQRNIISSNNNNAQSSTTDSIEIKNPLLSTKEIFDNRRTPLPNGAAPAIDGETPTIKRSYTLRNSTIRKINELKSIHPDINIYVSTIVDIAIAHYYNHILTKGGHQ